MTEPVGPEEPPVERCELCGRHAYLTEIHIEGAAYFVCPRCKRKEDK